MSDTQNERLANSRVNENKLTVADFSRRLGPPPPSCSGLRTHIAELKNIAVLADGSQVMQDAKAMGERALHIARGNNTPFRQVQNRVVLEGFSQATAMARIGDSSSAINPTGQVAV
jgi:hypothetical protein